MPQVFSVGWLYLFLFLMAIGVVWIWVKIRAIQKEAPTDRPIIKVAPVSRKDEEPEKKTDVDSLLTNADGLIKKGDCEAALKSLENIIEDLSPIEDRESRGKVLFRIAACHTRLAAGEDRVQHQLKAGEALRETVRLFTPTRYRNHYLRALGELAGLFEDIALEKNPVENLTQSARTCETAADSAREGGLTVPEAVFLVRAGNAYRQLVTYSEPQINLRKAVDLYGKAAAILETVVDESVRSVRMKALKVQGDAYSDLAKYYQKPESLRHAVDSYKSALNIMDATQHSHERCVVLTDISGILLQLYDMEKGPAHLNQALRCSRDAMGLAKEEGDLVSRGNAMAAMGDALTRYAEVKDRAENLERAAKLFKAALGILKDGEDPARLKRIRESLEDTVGKINAESGSLNST